MKFYAELNTDKIIREKYFQDLSYKGIIVEVGGATPEFLSMSKHFQENGWRSIIIEPNPMFVELQKQSGNEVYQYACSYENKNNIDFTIITQNVETREGVITDHSFSSIYLKQEYSDLLKTSRGFEERKIKVDVKRLGDILDELSINNVDILSIDTEGWEIEVMNGIDVEKTNIKLVVMENLMHLQSYTEYMESIGYTLRERIEYNYIYTKKDQ